MKEKRRFGDNKLTLKILAVLIAILLWVIVVNVSDPIIESTYSGITVEVLNTELLSATNETYQVLDATDNITVTLSAKRSISDLLGKENIRATADMADLNRETGTIPIRLETTKYNDKIESIKSKTKTVSIEVEDLVRKQFRINPVVNGEPTDGYKVGDVLLDQNVVTVQGPASVMERIDHVTAEVSVTGMSGSISTTSNIRYYDSEDIQLSASRLSSNISSVSIQVELLATKSVGFSFNYSGEPAEGYGVLDEISADPEEVLVAGKASTIANLTAITIPATAMDVTGLAEDKEFLLDLKKYLPEGLSLADADFDGMITVTVPIEAMQTRSFEVKRSNVEITGTAAGFKASLSATGDTFAVSLTGMKSELEDLKGSSIKGTVSVASYMEDRGIAVLEKGVYAMPVVLELPENVNPATDPILVQVRITEE